MLEWPEENNNFFDITNNNFLVNIKWSGNNQKDYSQLAESYIQCAYEVCKHIVESGHNNIKSDMWILPSIYMFRQGMELAIKTLICRSIDSKPTIQRIFLKYKHDLYGLFTVYNEIGEIYLDKHEVDWLLTYLEDLEDIDKNSDLFRYPFNDEFLDKYKDKFLDIVDMANNIIQSYLLIEKCLNGGTYSSDIKFDKNRIPQFLMFAHHGIGNCYLWWDSIDKFGRNIRGYSEVVEFLFLKCNHITNEQKVYPVLFLLRNSIELELKQIFYKSTELEHGVAKKIFNRKRKSHLIYKELWKNIRPTIEYYNNSKKEYNIINIVEEQLCEFEKIDRNGDIFRYPTSYSLEYKFDNKEIDLSNVFNYMKGIFNFLDGCDAMLDCRKDYEAQRWEEAQQYY